MFGVCAECDGRTVGIRRIVGGLFFEVVDVAFVTGHQKRGFGRMIMEALPSWRHDNAPPTTYVSFYERYGFRVRTPESSGMSSMTLRAAQSL
ncbi:MAG TPA: GNAT family N-acetyltransferase [Rubrobacter sp.]|nr:GNAT family N-acetyltransferase [Rubrobacter sp.]